MTTTKRALALAVATLAPCALAAPTLWVSDSDGTLGRVNLADGAVSIVGQMGRPMTDIAFNAEGELWGVDGSNLYRIDRANAATQFVSGLGQRVNSLVFDADGTLYAANDRLMTIDTRNASIRMLGSAPSGFDASGDLAFVAGSLYLSSTWPTPDTLFRIDATLGTAQAVGQGLGVGQVYGLASDDNIHLYGLSGRNVVSIDVATGTSQALVSYAAHGALGPAWGTAFMSEALAATVGPASLAPVPEPPSAWLAALGCGWLLRRLRTAPGPQVPPT